MANRLAEFLYEKAKSEIDRSEDQYEIQLSLARKEAEETALLYERWLKVGRDAFTSANPK